MKIFDRFIEQLGSLIGPAFGMIKKRVFGLNNERLDFIVDSFYKLSSSRQKGVLIGVSAFFLVVVLGAFGVYFTKVHSLESDLSSGFESLHRIRVLSAKFAQEKEGIRSLKSSIGRKMARFRPKAFFEKKANEVGVTLESLRSDESDIAGESPLSKDFKYVNVDFRLPKVSIPRLLKFFREIEKSDKNLTVKNLTIKARYGDRLFFDAQARVIGFKVLEGR